jgi:hypothetical protein
MQDILYYVMQGIKHVLPFGIDHILFMLCIFFKNSNLSYLLRNSILFSIAHSIALLIAISYNFKVSEIIEPLIALTILIAAIENIINLQSNKYYYVIILIFGVIHGLGFAIAFKEIQGNNLLFSVISFNIGVELAQILILMIAYLLYIRVKSWKNYYSFMVKPINTIIAIIAIYWLWIRT